MKNFILYNMSMKFERKNIMNRKLIIDGNAVYEIDKDCMLKKRLDKKEKENEEKKKKNLIQNRKEME